MGVKLTFYKWDTTPAGGGSFANYWKIKDYISLTPASSSPERKKNILLRKTRKIYETQARNAWKQQCRSGDIQCCLFNPFCCKMQISCCFIEVVCLLEFLLY
uniref:Uncharacterized protein n=2 Tax=Opuntia streptacantha TaxID=393608 RepID=A0A7C8YJX4_OPUST